MRNKTKNIFLGIVALFITAATILTSFFVNKREVMASDAQLDVTFEVYKQDEYTPYAAKAAIYEKWTFSLLEKYFYDSELDDNAYYFYKKPAVTTAIGKEYNKYKNGTYTFTDGYFNLYDIKNLGVTVTTPGADELALLHSLWDWTADPDDFSELYFKISGVSVSPYAYFGGYPEDLMDSTGKLIDPPVKPEECTTFEPGEGVAILIYAQGKDTNTAVIAMDQELRSASGNKILTGAKPYPGTRIPGFFDSESPKIYSDSDSSTGSERWYVTIGGQFNSENDKTSDKILLGGMSFTIPSSGVASDTYKLDNVVAPLETQWGVNGVTVNQSGVTASKFNIQSDKTITVNAANSDNEITSLDYSTNGKGKKYTSSVPTDISNKLYTDTTFGEYWVVDYDKTDSTKQFQYVTLSDNSVIIKPTVKGNIKNVYYTDDLTKNNILTQWTKASNSGSNYTISGMSAAGKGYYAAIELWSTDNTVKKTYIVSIPKESYHDAALSTFTINSVTAGSSGATKSVLDPAFGSATTTNTTDANGFKHYTTSYTIKVPADCTGINFTPTFDNTTKKMTAKLGGTTTVLSSGASSNVAKNAFSIVVTAQDGVTDHTYNFSFTNLSNDKSLTLSAFTNGTYSGTATFDGVDTYTINNVPFAVKQLAFTATNTNHAKITLGSGTSDINNVPTSINPLTANGYLAATTNTTITVESESGLSQTYNLVINRDAANTNSKLDKANTIIYDSMGTAINGAWGSGAAENTWTASNNVAYKSGTTVISGFYVTPVGHADNGTNYTMKVGATAVASGSNTPTTSFTVITSDDAKSLTLRVIAEDTSYTDYTFNVTRDKADDDRTITFQIFDITNGAHTDISTQFALGTGSAITNATPLDSSIKSVEIIVTPTSTKSTAVIYGTTTDATVAQSKSLTQSKNVETTTYKVTVTAESANHTDYTFNIKAAGLNTDNKIQDIEVIGNTDPSETKTITYTGSNSGVFSFAYTMDGDKNTEFIMNATPKNNKQELYWSTNVNAAQGRPGDPTFTADPFTNGLVFDVSDTVTYYLFVIPENPTTANGTYTVNVKFVDKRDKNNKINNIQLAAIDNKGVETPITWTFNQAASPQTSITVPYSVVKLKAYVTLDSTKATLATPSQTYANALAGFDITLHGITGNADTSKVYYFQAQAENTDLGTNYEVQVIRQKPETGNDITSLTVNGDPATLIATDTYVARVARTNASAAVALTVDTNATFEANKSGSSATYTTSPFTVTGLIAGTATIVNIRVKSEQQVVDNVTASHGYTLYIMPADTANTIDNISILETDEFGSPLKNTSNAPYTFASGVTPISFEISYAAKNPYFEVTNTTTPYSEITGAGSQPVTQNKTSDTNKIVTISSLSEYGKMLKAAGLTVPTTETVSYKFNITRKAASGVNTLESLSFDFPGDPSKNKTYTKAELATITGDSFENLGASASVTVTYVKTDGTSLVTGLTDPDSVGAKNGSSNEAFTIGVNSSQSVKITVNAENDAKKSWTFYFAYSSMVLDTTSEITKISLKGDVDTADILGFNKTVNPYDKHLGGKNTKAVFKIDLGSTTSSLKIDGNNWDPVNDYEVELAEGESKTINVTCISQKGDASTGGTSTSYQITVTRDTLDDDSTLDIPSLTEKQGSGPVSSFTGTATGTNTYTVIVPNSVTTYVLNPTPTSAKATIDSNNANPLTLDVGENTAIINVKSEKGTTTPYTFKVIRKADLSLDTLEVQDTEGDLITYTGTDHYAGTRNVGYSTDSVTVNAVATDPDHTTVTISGNTNLVAGQANTITVTVKDKATNDTKDYTIDITRSQGDGDVSIIKYVTEGNAELSAAELANTTISYQLPVQIDTFDPAITVAATSKVILPTDRSLQPHAKNEKKIIVEAEDGTKQEYTINVYCASKTYTIEDIKLYDSEGNEVEGLQETKLVYANDKYDYEIIVPYSKNSLTIQVTPTEANAYVYIDSTQANDKTIAPQDGKTTTYKVYALSEYGYLSGDNTSKSSTYNIRIKRLAQETDPRLDTLVIKAGGQILEFNTPFDKDTEEYIIENIGESISAVDVSATPYKESTKVIGTGNWSLDATSGEANYIFTITVTGQAENGDTKKYTVKISRGPLDLSTEKNINYLTLVDSNGAEYIGESENWENDNYIKNVTIPYGPQSITFNANKLSVSKSTIYFLENNVTKQSSQTNTSYQVSIDATHLGNSFVYKVYAQAEKADENGQIKGQVYTINVTFVEPSEDAGLTELMVDGVTVTGFSAADIDKENGTTYTYTVEPIKANDRLTTTITAKASDTKTKVTGTGTQTLKVGPNYFTVVATAESGHQISYIIRVDRDEEDPYLFNLSLDGEVLLNAADKATTFQSNVLEYHAKVLNTTKTISIKTSSPNVNYTVTTSNTTLSDISANGLVRTFEGTDLKVGNNEFQITVTSSTNTNKKTIYKLTVMRRDELSADTGINQITIKEVNADGGKELVPEDLFEFDNKSSQYSFTVPNTVTDLDLAISLANAGGQVDANGETIDPATVEIIGDKDLKTGLNNVFVVVTAADGVTTRLVQLNVTREPYEFEVESKTKGVEKISDDFASDKLTKATVYNVANKVSTFDVKGINALTDAEDEQPVVTLTNNGKLAVGENNVTMTITAPDGKVITKEFVINRAPMKYTVNKTAYEYACEEADAERYYTINLVDKTASAIEDYAKYIEFDTELYDLDVEVLTNTASANTNEVLVRVSTKDKAESEVVHFQLVSTQINKSGSMFDIIFWIILGISIILLIIILICVNRDKYGSVSKNRKRA